jgi:hypothetical protein
MGHPRPHVFIDGMEMGGTAGSSRPVLAGLTLNFGVDNDGDMQEVESASFEMTVPAGQGAGSLDFLQPGKIVAIYHDPTTGTESDFTYFVGRIARMEAHPDEKLAGALRVAIEAVDLTADLEALVVEDINSAEASGADRMGHMNYWLDDDWSMAAYPVPYPTRMHAALHYQSKPFLELIDQYLRAQLMVRRNASYYKPGEGITRQLVALADAARDVAADKLAKNADGTWKAIPGQPTSNGALLVQLPASNVLADAGWAMEPDDVITEVTMNAIRPAKWNAEDFEWEDSTTVPKTSRTYVDTTALRAKYGVKTVSMDTDMPRDYGTTQLAPMMEHWLTRDGAQWRTKTITIRDSDLLPITTLGYLLAPTSRFSIMVAIDGVTDARPDHGQPDIRGLVIGGEATWNGTKWEITLTLARPPLVPATADYWTPALIKASPTFSTGKCNTVGPALTFAHFKRIGP